jgi:hypothetical protein
MNHLITKKEITKAIEESLNQVYVNFDKKPASGKTKKFISSAAKHLAKQIKESVKAKVKAEKKALKKESKIVEKKELKRTKSLKKTESGKSIQPKGVSVLI